MTAIDFIEVGKPMPKYVPDFRALNDTGYHNLIKSLEARVKPEYGFSYVPYLPWNINEFDITKLTRCLTLCEASDKPRRAAPEATASGRRPPFSRPRAGHR